MSMDYIRKNYGVPAKRGGRVEYTGCGKAELGTITGADGAYLCIRLDGLKQAGNFHPTWELRYLPETLKAEIPSAHHKTPLLELPVS